MTGAKRKETTKLKQISTPTLPQITGRDLRPRPSIIDGADGIQLSEESMNLLSVLERKFDAKFSELN